MDDRVLERLRTLDPSLDDPAPQDGSDRYRAILHRTTVLAERAPARRPAPRHRHAARTAGRRRLPVAVLAAVLLVAVGSVLLVPQVTPSAQARIRDAAAALATVDSLRAQTREEYPDGHHVTSRGAFNGRDGRVDIVFDYGDGDPDVHELTVVGDTMWTIREGGGDSIEQLGPQERLAPFPQASAAVVSAALAGGDATELGVDPLVGVEATRYRVTLDATSVAALRQLAPGELSWFGLEDPAAVEFLEVWVADEMIHRIDVHFSDTFFMTMSSNRFFDFGAEITIEAPTSGSR